MPSVSNLFKQGALRWEPDSDAVSAQDGLLLRATNLVPDETGALSLRRGSSKLYTSIGTDIDSLYTTKLIDGTTYRMAGSADRIYSNGISKASSVDGSGDIIFGDDSIQVFAARGTTKKKWDGTTLNNWGIERPIEAPTLSASSAITSTVCAFDGEDNPAPTITYGSGTIGAASDENGTANEATTIVPDGTTFLGGAKRLWNTYGDTRDDQDFFTISGIEGSDTDLFDIYINFESPQNVERVRIAFGVGDSGTTPFKDDSFIFDFNLQDGLDIPLKDLQSEGYDAYNKSVTGTVSSINPWEKTGINNPFAVKQTLANITEVQAPKSTAPDAGVWGHLTVTRGQFRRIGTKSTRGWNTVRGFQIEVKNINGKSGSFTVSDAIWIGGGNRCLTGTFRCVLQAVREFKDSSGNTIYYEKSPPSEESDSISLKHQSLVITISAATLTAIDSQVNQIWVYLFGGWLDAYYRFAITGSEPPTGMTIDELTTPDGTTFGTVRERARWPSWGFTYSEDTSPSGTPGVPAGTGSTTITLTIQKSELEALTENVRLDPYLMGPPDNIIGIAGPWRQRMFALTSVGYVYPSLQNSPSAFNTLQVIDLSLYGEPLWIAKTGTGIYVGCEKDIIFLFGSGDNSPDGATIDLYGQPLNLGNPPVDSMYWVDGNSVIYRSSDGLMMLTGSGVQPIPTNGTSLLWRGQDRHGISALNITTGRFRCAIDNYMLYVIAPEGTDTESNVIYRYSFPSQQWSRLKFTQAGNLRSIFNDPDGSLIAGDDNGTIWLLESGNQDDGEDIYVDVLTPITDGGNPLDTKDPFDLQLHMDSGGDSLTVNVYKDGSSSLPTSYTAYTNRPEVWRAQADDIGNFIKAQLSITGYASSFVLSGINLTYRKRAQRMVYLDTGYYMSQEPGDYVWMQELEFDANCSSSSFTTEVYFNDALAYSVDTTTSTGIRKVYIIPLPRGSKGSRPRVVFKSSDTSGRGDIGFDAYSVRARVVGSGNQDAGRQYVRMWPSGEAP